MFRSGLAERLVIRRSRKARGSWLSDKRSVGHKQPGPVDYPWLSFLVLHHDRLPTLKSAHRETSQRDYATRKKPSTTGRMHHRDNLSMAVKGRYELACLSAGNAFLAFPGMASGVRAYVFRQAFLATEHDFADWPYRPGRLHSKTTQDGAPELEESIQATKFPRFCS